MAEQIFMLVAQRLLSKSMSVRDAFGQEDMIHVLPEFDGEENVEVMTSDDFVTRCYQIGVQQLNEVQIACVLRVLGKPELSNAIRLNELEMLMQNFMPKSRQASPSSERANKKNRRKKLITELLDNQPDVLSALKRTCSQKENLEK